MSTSRDENREEATESFPDTSTQPPDLRHELAREKFVTSIGNPRIELRLGEIAKQLIPGKVLDIGCRDGYLQTFLDQKHEYYGVDIVDSGAGTVKNLSLCDVTKEPLPFKDGFFDNVVAGEFLEHISDFYSVVQELGRVLRPGGRIIITVPNLARFYYTSAVIRRKNYLRQFTKETLDKPDEHIHGFNEKLLASLLQHHGMESIYCDRVYNYHNGHKLPEWRILKMFALYVLVVGEKRPDSSVSGTSGIGDHEGNRGQGDEGS
jgi:SAM-dependent methyltransferase